MTTGLRGTPRQLGKNGTCLFPVPNSTGGLDFFFLGRIPTLGLAGLRCRAGGAAGWLCAAGAKPPNPHSLPRPCYTCYMCYMALTRRATEHPLSPGSLLYVLYVLYLTRQATEHSFSHGSLLYVLYVLYGPI